MATNVDYIQIDDDDDTPTPKSSIRLKKELVNREAKDDDDMDVCLPSPEWFDDDDECASSHREQATPIPCAKARPSASVQRKRRKKNLSEGTSKNDALTEGRPKTKRRKKAAMKRKKAVEAQHKAVEEEEEKTAVGDVSEGEDLDTALPVEQKSSADGECGADQTLGDWTSDNDLIVLFESPPTASATLNERQKFVKREIFNKHNFTCQNNGSDYIGRDLSIHAPTGSKYGVVSNADRRIMKSISGCRNQFPKEFNQFNKSIWSHLTTNLQNDHTFTWKMRVRLALHNQIRLLFPNSLLLVVGSTVNGCGAYNSDMDLCLGIPCPVEQFSTSKGYAGKNLRKVRNVLSMLSIVRHVEYIPAKVPILKMNFGKPYSNLEVDINVNNFAGVYNSFLLHNYSRIDDRFPAICLLVKHWAKVKGIGDACGGFLNSYSLILMVLHFLQCGVEPPVLPNLQQLYPDLFSLRHPFNEYVFFSDLPFPLPEIAQNDRTVGELLIAFFAYYNHFDFNRYAISVRRGCLFPRTELPSNTKRFRLFIEEPFDQLNTARCVTNDEQWMVILDAFGKAAEALSPNSNQAPDLQRIGIRIL